MRTHKLYDRCTALLLAAILLLLTSCGGNDATAATMHLIRTEGTVAVSDGDGKDVPLLENLGLYSGYGVGTRSASYAWINLDDVKLTKLDQDSEIAVRQEGKALEIEVKSGSLFFNVTEPLEDDETMNIRTSTMMVGIRGTCGWVEENNGLSRAYLLEGKVECSAEGQTVQVNAWEMAELTADGELTVAAFTEQDLPTFVRDELGLDGMDGSEAPEPTPTTTDDELTEEDGPVYLLMRQSGYTPGGALVREYVFQYDAQGYILSVEHIEYDIYDGSSESYITTYEYTGAPGRCRVIPDRQYYRSEEDWLAAQEETIVRPGEPAGHLILSTGQEYSFYTSPLTIPEERAAVLANGGILTNVDEEERWAYAVYTFDEAGNPTYIVTYNDADTVTGTATLEWRLLDVS